jgi:hypothetical protein
MGGDGLELGQDDYAHGGAHAHDHDERGVPAEVVPEPQADGEAEHLAGAEGGLYEAHHASAHLHGEQVGDDGHGDGSDDPAENSGDDARRDQELVGGRDAAEQGSDDEPREEEEQELLAVELVGEAGREDSGNARGEGVGGDRQSELLRGDGKRRHEQGSQGAHDHEVEDDAELEEGQHGDDELLVRRENMGLSGGVHGYLRVSGLSKRVQASG